MLCCLFQAVSLSAQTSPKTPSDYKFAFKVYSNFQSYYISNGKSNYSVEMPTIALQWKLGKKNWQEIELQRISASTGVYTPDNGQLPAQMRRRTTLIAVNYEYNWSFLKKTHKFSPSIGFGIAPRINTYHSNSLDVSGYKVSNLVVSVRAYITPRLIYNITPRLFGDVNVPITFYNSSTTFSHSKTPNGTLNGTYYSTSQGTIVPRIGVGYRF